MSLALPEWARWTLAGVALAAGSCLAIAFLIGPAARRLAGEHRRLTPIERVEAVNAARHTLIQAAAALVVIGGVVFTAQAPWHTAQTLDASQARVTSELGQNPDRYTKAVEQLGSGKLDVRLGGLYALERLAQDSPRDHQTVYDVLAAFIREHDPGSAARTPVDPAPDIQAALTLIGRRSVTLDRGTVDLRDTRIPGGNLSRANLSRAVLIHADLTGANLARADLSGADLTGAHLTGAHLSYADLTGGYLTLAVLFAANLFGADLANAYLGGADLIGADLRGADLAEAHLDHADLRDAHLAGADLTGAFLGGADLGDADLRGVVGATEQEIRARARVNSGTRFR
jgi:hypothetical protein